MGTGISPDNCKFLTIEKRNAITVYQMRFPSVGAIQMFLRDDPPINTMIFVDPKSATADERFAGPALDKAIDYCVSGYEEGYDQFMEFSKQLEAVNTRYVRERHVEKAFVGQRPNVPAYIAGAPKTMYRSARAEEKKTINIFMNVTYPASTSPQQILHRGIISLNLIKVLEMNGYIVNFRLFESSMMREEVFICEVVLKRPGDKLDSRKCYYPMCGKGFVRRIMARLKESMPFKYNWGMSYGNVLRPDLAKNLMGITNKDIYIGAPADMNIRGVDLYEDADRFLETLGIADKIAIPKYRK